MIRIVVLALGLLVSPPLLAQSPPREVNIQMGSEAGWVPSDTLEQQARAAFDRFNALTEAGDYPAAHAMLSDSFAAAYPLARFGEQREEGRAARGALVSRKVLQLTWAKDVPGAPVPGIFAVFDSSARFEQAERFCGYTVLHLAPGASDFRVMRIEENGLDDATFAAIAAQHSPVQALLVWRLLARSCPNFTPEPLPADLSAGIEYTSVAEARTAVAARPGIDTRTINGWAVLTDEAARAIWSFAPESSPAYPAVIKRWVDAVGENASAARMAMLCEGDKRTCDAAMDDMALKNGFTPVSFEQ